MLLNLRDVLSISALDASTHQQRRRSGLVSPFDPQQTTPRSAQFNPMSLPYPRRESSGAHVIEISRATMNARSDGDNPEAAEFETIELRKAKNSALSDGTDESLDGKRQ